MEHTIDPLSEDERRLLLHYARQAIELGVYQIPSPILDLSKLPRHLSEKGASFVTLTINGELRGCVGALEAYQPLVEDVCEHAIAAALQDYRFPPLEKEEVSKIKIEISRLTKPTDLDYDRPEELVSKLRPNIDGVTLFDGWRRATFLPQVWSKLPEPALFLDHLCDKMGAPHNIWKKKILKVQVYQVEEFHE